MSVPISAVIPVHNRETIIEKAIDSVLAQDRPPAEIIVVDDGSSDATARVVEERYGDLVRLVSKPNGGAASARNRGVVAATSDWIAFLDSDDVWLPGHLGRMQQAIDGTDGKAAFYFADMEDEFGSGNSFLWDRSDLTIDGPWDLRADAMEWVLLDIQPTMVQSSVIARSVFNEVGGFDERLGHREDTHLFFKVGIGRPGCAVSGTGVRRTSDDEDSGNRVTQRHGTESPTYWHFTALIYSDILDGDYRMSEPDRARVKQRLAAAHMRIARLEKGLLAPTVVRHLAQAFRVDPKLVTRKAVDLAQGLIGLGERA